MIRYPVSEDELLQEINAKSGSWLERVSEHTELFRQKEHYCEPPNPVWSQIKSVYMKFQHNKCAFCECKLAGLPHGAIVHDVEHFRPKKRVDRFAPVIDERPIVYDFPIGDASDNGYYLLPYNPLNYVTTCKPCNSYLKANYFPIGGIRHIHGEHPRELKSEKAWLIYPLDGGDDDPEDIITFEGIMPIARHSMGDKKRRATIIIDFFRLSTREELLEERAHLIIALDNALKKCKDDPDLESRAAFAAYVRFFKSPRAPHSNCLRSFMTLYGENPVGQENS